jgi:DNA invertase Pin-like site-specific DNA recombinase
MVGAVIYVRVSTKEQTENLSLPTQLRACEEYCRRQGYEVLERFHEEGESAKSTDRSQLQNLLTYCRLNKGRVHFVVVFNLTRFARDKYDHFALRSHLQSLGISLRSATEPIDDTSTGKLMEGVLAAFAQFDNDVRSDRTRAGMKAALELGRWVFLAPIGYLNAPRSMGKSLIHDPERAPQVRRAFEEYATGRSTKEELLKRARGWGLTNRRGKPLTSQAIGVLLRNQLYAGIVDVPEYGVRCKRGDFDALISEDVFYRAQSVLSGRTPRTAPRLQGHPDFPLRGFVRCDACGRGLTGSWSKGRSEYYAYYHCRPGCRAVNVTKATLEGLFADQLALLQPTPGYMRLLKESVLQIWKARKAAFATRSRRPNVRRRPSKRSSTAWPKHSCSNARSTSKRTTATPRSCARSSRSRESTVTPASSKNSTWKASSRSQNGFCRARPTCGSRPHSTSDSGSNNCSFRTESPSTENALLEPAQLHRSSATCGKSEPKMKVWWTRRESCLLRRAEGEAGAPDNRMVHQRRSEATEVGGPDRRQLEPSRVMAEPSQGHQRP